MSEFEGIPETQSQIPLSLIHQGKVRDVYDAGNNLLLMVASDRVSAFDKVLPQPIPKKGEVLTQLTAWWLDSLGEQIDHHLISVDTEEIIENVPILTDSRDAWEKRSMLVHLTDPVLVECVVRGYISGSAWKEYRTSGTLAGEPLPEGLSESDRLEQPIFSPATKAHVGHDENIPFSGVIDRLGDETANRLRELSFKIYSHGVNLAEERGIILADTKFEFGYHKDGRILLIDEVLTPDSSRFWPSENYVPGQSQHSLDKQPVRDFLDVLGWDKSPPPPDLPEHVVNATTERYLEIFRRLTGVELNAFEAPSFS